MYKCDVAQMTAAIFKHRIVIVLKQLSDFTMYSFLLLVFFFF